MDEDIAAYLSRIDNILNAIDTNTNIQREKNKTATNKKNKKVDYNNITPEQLNNLCYRTSVLYTKGIYIPVDKPYTCKKNKKKISAPRKYESKETDTKTTFGQGRVGVSCDSYGIKNCACCRPDNNTMQPNLLDLILTDMYPDLENRNDRNLIKNTADPSVIIDLTQPSSSTFISAPDSKEWNNTIISIADSSSLVRTKEETVLDYIDLENDNYEEERRIIEEYKADPESQIDAEIKLNAVNENQDRNIVETEDLRTAIKTEKEDNIANHSNVENIIDYINLVAVDFNEDAMKKYEEEIEASILNETDSVGSSLSESTAVVNNVNIPVNILGLEENPKPPLNKVHRLTRTKKTKNLVRPKTKIVNTNNSIIEIFDSPVTSKTIKKINNPESTPSALPISFDCSICLETLKGKEIMSTICGHVFCTECIKQVIKKTKKCPICRKALTLKSIHPLFLN